MTETNTTTAPVAEASSSESDGWPEPDYSDVPTVYLEQRKAENEEKKKKFFEERKKERDNSKPKEKSSEKEPETKPAAAAAAAAAETKRKIKVKGQDLEVDEAKYHEYAQKGAAATQTWQEAAKLKKEAGEHLAKVKANPIAALKEMGINVDEIAEQHVWETIQRKTMTPEQIIAADKEREFNRLKDLETTTKGQIEAKKKEEARNYYAQEFDKKIASAISEAKLPRQPRAAQRVVDYLEAAIKQGYEPDIAEIGRNVRDDLIKETQELLADADDDTLLTLLGAKTVEKVRIALLKKLKGEEQPRFNAPSEKPKAKPATSTRRLVADSKWRDNLIGEYLGRR